MNYEVEDPKFNHIDVMFGINAPELVYPKILTLLNIYH